MREHITLQELRNVYFLSERSMLHCYNAKQSKLLHLDENQATQYRLATTTELVGKTIYLDFYTVHH